MQSKPSSQNSKVMKREEKKVEESDSKKEVQKEKNYDNEDKGEYKPPLLFMEGGNTQEGNDDEENSDQDDEDMLEKIRKNFETEGGDD